MSAAPSSFDELETTSFDDDGILDDEADFGDDADDDQLDILDGFGEDDLVDGDEGVLGDDADDDQLDILDGFGEDDEMGVLGLSKAERVKRLQKTISRLDGFVAHVQRTGKVPFGNKVFAVFKFFDFKTTPAEAISRAKAFKAKKQAKLAALQAKMGDGGVGDEFGYLSEKEIPSLPTGKLRRIANDPFRRKAVRAAARAEIERRAAKGKLGKKGRKSGKGKGIERFKRREAEVPVESEEMDEGVVEESDEMDEGAVEESEEEMGAQGDFWRSVGAKKVRHPVVWKAAKSMFKLSDAERDEILRVLPRVRWGRLQQIANNPARSALVREAVYDEMLRRKHGGGRRSWSSGPRSAPIQGRSQFIPSPGTQPSQAVQIRRRRPAKVLPGLHLPPIRVANPVRPIANAMKSSAELLREAQRTAQDRARRGDAARARAARARAKAQAERAARARAAAAAEAARRGQQRQRPVHPLTALVRPARPAHPRVRGGAERRPPIRGGAVHRPARLGGVEPAAPAGFEVVPKLGSAVMAHPFKAAIGLAAVFGVGAWVGRDRIEDAVEDVLDRVRG